MFAIRQIHGFYCLLRSPEGYIYDEFSNSSTVPVQNKPFLSPAEYRQFSLEKRAKLLPPPSDDRMEELKIGRETQTERELNSTQRCLK